jgi:hypothetical protein
MRSEKSECLERIVFFGERSLRRALAEFVKYYHGERNHQGFLRAHVRAKREPWARYLALIYYEYRSRSIKHEDHLVAASDASGLLSRLVERWGLRHAWA